MDVETFYDGYLTAIIVDEGSVTPVGSTIALLADPPRQVQSRRALLHFRSLPTETLAPSPPPATEALASPPPPSPAAPSPVSASSSTHPATEGGRRVVATPFAKKHAKDLKVELGSIAGTEPMGRIVAKDVESNAAAAATPATAAVVPTPAAPPKSAPSASPAVELGSVVPFTTMQGAVSRNMVESLSVPTFRVGYNITTDALDALYKLLAGEPFVVDLLAGRGFQPS